MTLTRFAVATFCDDVRQEVGNKYSLMGCYGDELVVEALPVALPKVCAHVRASTTLDQLFAALTCRAKLNGEVISELTIQPDQLLSGQRIAVARSQSDRVVVVLVLQFAPFGITEPSNLRIEVETESEILHGGTLQLRQRQDGDPLPPLMH